MARLAAALVVNAVAVAAGLTLVQWTEVGRPHIFRGLGGFLGGRNRGRLPFIEYDCASQGFDQESISGGTITQTITLRAHVGGRVLGTAGDLSEAMLTAALASIRSEAVDNLTAIGGDSIGPLVASPWGLSRDATLTIEQSYSRSTYEAT